MTMMVAAASLFAPASAARRLASFAAPRLAMQALSRPRFLSTSTTRFLRAPLATTLTPLCRRWLSSAPSSSAVTNAAQTAEEPLTAWGIKLAIENGFLSWTRNAVISTIAGAAFYNIDPIASSGLFGMALLFLGSGVVKYWNQSYQVRHRVKTSRVSLLLIPPVLFGCAALSLWSLIEYVPDTLRNFEASKAMLKRWESRKQRVQARLSGVTGTQRQAQQQSEDAALTKRLSATRERLSQEVVSLQNDYDGLSTAYRLFYYRDAAEKRQRIERAKAGVELIDGLLAGNSN